MTDPAAPSDLARLLAPVVHCSWCDAEPYEPCQEWDKPIPDLHFTRRDYARSVATVITHAGYVRPEPAAVPEVGAGLSEDEQDAICEALAVACTDSTDANVGVSANPLYAAVERILATREAALLAEVTRLRDEVERLSDLAARNADLLIEADERARLRERAGRMAGERT